MDLLSVLIRPRTSCSAEVRGAERGGRGRTPAPEADRSATSAEAVPGLATNPPVMSDPPMTDAPLRKSLRSRPSVLCLVLGFTLEGSMITPLLSSTSAAPYSGSCGDAWPLLWPLGGRLVGNLRIGGREKDLACGLERDPIVLRIEPDEGLTVLARPIGAGVHSYQLPYRVRGGPIERRLDVVSRAYVMGFYRARHPPAPPPRTSARTARPTW